jgi:hypothetical protein
MNALAPWMIPADLAPGDKRFPARDWAALHLDIIDSPAHPLFSAAFDTLWSEFGPSGEMESLPVIESRMQRLPAAAPDGFAMRYRLMVVRHAGEIAAVTDQTAILANEGREIIVHHSHVLVAPAWRRTGLAGWIRALPVATARELMRSIELPPATPVTLALEMEHPDASVPQTLIRLAAMEKAGYRKVDPSRSSYLQPDFRAVHEIDASGPRPLPFALVLRRIAREHEETITAGEVRRIATALHAMYARELRAAEIETVRTSFDRNHPPDDATIPLVAPTFLP